MASKPSPAFLLYTGDWRGSRRVSAMSFAERGMYMELLIEQWEKGGVPASPVECAKLLGGKPAEWRRAWEKLQACFTVDRRKSDGLLVNAKLEAVRRERLKYQKSQRESGMRGARLRWKKHSEPIGSPSKPIGSPMAKNGSSSSSSSSLSSSSSNVPALTRGADGSGEPSSTALAKTPRPHDGNGTGLRERFDAFWQVYPRKVGKDAAWKAWQRRQPSADLTQQICAALAWQRQQDQWLKDGGQFVPNPATWINAGRWQDEPSTTPRVSDRTLSIGRAVEEFLK